MQLWVLRSPAAHSVTCITCGVWTVVTHKSTPLLGLMQGYNQC